MPHVCLQFPSVIVQSKTRLVFVLQLPVLLHNAKHALCLSSSFSVLHNEKHASCLSSSFPVLLHNVKHALCLASSFQCCTTQKTPYVCSPVSQYYYTMKYRDGLQSPCGAPYKTRLVFVSQFPSWSARSRRMLRRRRQTLHLLVTNWPTSSELDEGWY